MIKDTIVNGAHNAPHRSLYNALGLTREELDRPLIGIVSSYNEIVPGHMNPDKIVEAVGSPCGSCYGRRNAYRISCHSRL